MSWGMPLPQPGCRHSATSPTALQGLHLSAPSPGIQGLLCPRTGTASTWESASSHRCRPPGHRLPVIPRPTLGQARLLLLEAQAPHRGDWIPGDDMTGRLSFFLILVVMIWVLPRLM